MRHEKVITQEFFLDRPEFQNNQRLVIIPAAGFGVRVGSPPAKELLPHPYFRDKNFLEVAIERAKNSHAAILVLSRIDKTILNDWLEASEVPHIRFEKTAEWVDSFLMSKNYWKMSNALLLPDADFSPQDILTQLFLDIESHVFHMSFGVFKVLDLRKWGGIKIKRNEKILVVEKIKSSCAQEGTAWGVIAFKKEVGALFWQSYLESQALGEWVSIEINAQCHHLDYFIDLTRNTNDLV